MKSSELNLDEFFSHLAGEIYTVVKLDPDFPSFRPGSDIDLFCYDARKVLTKILEVAHRYANHGFTIRITDLESGQIHADVLKEDNLIFRFDLYQRTPAYRKILVREGLLESVIENCRSIERTFNGTTYKLYVPSLLDEQLIRYLEFVECYEARPDKLKHLEYILSSVTEPGRIQLLDKVHRYTKLPPAAPPPAPKGRIHEWLDRIFRGKKRPRA